jgi:hypothetical protein
VRQPDYKLKIDRGRWIHGFAATCFWVGWVGLSVGVGLRSRRMYEEKGVRPSWANPADKLPLHVGDSGDERGDADGIKD